MSSILLDRQVGNEGPSNYAEKYLRGNHRSKSRRVLDIFHYIWWKMYIRKYRVYFPIRNNVKGHHNYVLLLSYHKSLELISASKHSH